MRDICGGKRESLTANGNDLISVSLKSFAPLPLEGADERSEAGLVSPNVGVPFHAANLRPFGAPPSKGRREKERRICAANENTRAPLRAPQSRPSKKRRIQI